MQKKSSQVNPDAYRNDAGLVLSFLEKNFLEINTKISP
jgi:hypothetical protein